VFNDFSEAFAKVLIIEELKKMKKPYFCKRYEYS